MAEKVVQDNLHSESRNEVLFRRGLRYFIDEFRQPGLNEANCSENPFTIPLDVNMIQEVIARLAHGEEPLQPGRSLPPAFKQKALELIYRKIELGLVDVLRIMTESRAEIVPALQMAGYLDPSHGLPDDFQDGVLQDLASAGIVKQITDGCYRDDTIDELVRMNKYQPYTLPHTELLMPAFSTYISTFEQRGVVYARTHANNYTSTVLEKRLPQLGRSWGRRESFAEPHIELPDSIKRLEAKLVAQEVTRQFIVCLNILKVTTQGGKLSNLVDLFRVEGLLKSTFLLPYDFITSPMAELARNCDYGMQYNENTHIPMRDWVVIPYMEKTRSL